MRPSTGRNAIAVTLAGGAVAIFEIYLMHPFSVAGNITPGLPPFRPPAFTVSDGNTTYYASDIFGVTMIVILFKIFINYFLVVLLA